MSKNTTRADHAAAIESAIAKCRWKLLPFLALMFALAMIDRSNVGFAKAALQTDIGLSNAAFALGAGIFFIGYAIFEVPSNLMLHRVGARLWLSRIMITWGLVSAAMMFTRDETTFYVLRFLLGVAEAGFSPGVILYLTYWFPAQRRGQAIGIYYFGLPMALMLGSPLSGWLLEMHGMFNLTNWQWMFLVEGLAAVVVGIIALFYLKSKPQDAPWLTREEKAALSQELEAEDQLKLAHGPTNLLGLVRNKRVLKFILIYFSVQVSVYGVIFYLPTRIAELLGTTVGFKVGMFISLPWLCAAVAMYFVTRYADRHGAHLKMAMCMLGLAALGIAASALLNSFAPVLLAFCFAAAGFVTVQPLFWTLPTGYLGGVAAAGGIALIGSMGNIGGFVAPMLKANMEVWFTDPRAGMLSLSAAGLVGVYLLWTLRAPKGPSLVGQSPLDGVASQGRAASNA
ncbi:MFS transporter [Pseudomonas fluorescens]|uniref:Inner membrane transport protein RhmT n=1 Tax=Pseudomonas fluorescens TaxID=294 RepID=A0A5E7VBP4_PSEFL|nr:MFS transporter [Pseudomonas fluorescens]VVO43744.1 Inner membrane transport protein RhmT [Pseudomonas fluorescens]VVQ21111.1 Inner membrane transport protein RhmT [Pseudomonas fluorescens]